MRVISKPLFTDRPHIFCVGRLLFDASIKQFDNGGEAFNALIELERMPRETKPIRENEISVKASGELAKTLLPWKRGTVLAICGMLVEDEYRTKKYGKQTWMIEAEWVEPRRNHRIEAQARHKARDVEKYERMTADNAGSEAGIGGAVDVDPGF